jgi:S-adenosylmethionine/arginine decarboxylase-like enzyme
MPEHKHLIIRAEVKHPITSEWELRKWLKNLVKIIDMKIVGGPYTAYVTKEGNRGITGVVMIETSHISIHIWDEERPSLVQCDIYSCAEFQQGEVIMHLGIMKPKKIEYMMVDRSEEISCEPIIIHTKSPYP